MRDCYRVLEESLPNALALSHPDGFVIAAAALWAAV